MNEKRNRRMQIKVLPAWVPEVREQLEAAGFAWREEPFEDGSVEFRFTKLTLSESARIPQLVPLKAWAQRGIVLGSVAHRSPEELKQLVAKRFGDDTT